VSTILKALRRLEEEKASAETGRPLREQVAAAGPPPRAGGGRQWLAAVAAVVLSALAGGGAIWWLFGGERSQEPISVAATPVAEAPAPAPAPQTEVRPAPIPGFGPPDDAFASDVETVSRPQPLPRLADSQPVVAYGRILKPRALAVPVQGSINVHASLLPELRGAAPINWAIARGHDRTGVTIMRMVEEMDAGAIIHRVEEPILADETAAELSIRLSEIGAAALVEALALLSTGQHPEVEQDHARATFAPKVDRGTARVAWARPAREVACLIRGMDEVPGAWTMLDAEPLKVFRPSLAEAVDGQGAVPGTIVAANGGLRVATDDGVLEIGEVQPAGGRRMRSADWVHGHRIEEGRRFE
jgi:methionyl-tRNA formyltransferase